MANPLCCSLAALEPSLLRHPLSVLNLTVRASNCLSHVASISALLDWPESQLIRQRHFGRTSLADVRRRVVHFCVDHLGVEVTHPIRAALYDPHPSVAAIWNAPAQARPLRLVIDELLDVLSRPEELRAAGTWSYSATAIGPPRPIQLEDVSLAEVIDGFFQPLRPRERRMIELRYGHLDGAGATLAEIGSEFGLTRERVRQILQVCLQRLASEAERQRREALTRFLMAAIHRAGGLIHEADLAAALQEHLRPPHPDSGSLLRALLDAEPLSMAAGHGVWASTGVSLEMVAELRDTFRDALRTAGRPLHRFELLAASRNGAGHGEAFVLSCLRTDDRLCCRDGERFGLVEWEWLVPSSLEDYIYLALRAAGRPRHYLWITEYVNTLVPVGSEVAPREVHSALLDQQAQFVRAREGTYALAEWGSADGTRIAITEAHAQHGTDLGGGSAAMPRDAEPADARAGKIPVAPAPPVTVPVVGSSRPRIGVVR